MFCASPRYMVEGIARGHGPPAQAGGPPGFSQPEIDAADALGGGSREGILRGSLLVALKILST